MKFNNRENEQIKLPNGKIHWNSRAVAVVGTIVVIKDKVAYVLISQRGSGAADHQGKWCLPCGYLDWDETTGEAFAREVWEECGVNVLELLENKVKKDRSVKSWDLYSNPIENRQNVCVHHGLVVKVKELPEYKIVNEVEANEVSDVKWVPLSDVEGYDFAFNHLERIYKFIGKFLKNKYSLKKKK